MARQQQTNKSNLPRRDQPQQPDTGSSLPLPERNAGQSTNDPVKGTDNYLSGLNDKLNNAPEATGEDPKPFDDTNEKFKDYNEAESSPTSPQDQDKSMAGIQQAEGEPAGGAGAIPYSPGSSKAEFKGKGKGIFRGRGRKGIAALTGVGISVALIGGIVAGTAIFKGNLFSGMLNDFYSKATRHMVESRMRAYMFGWVRKDLLEGSKKCGSTVNLSCINKLSDKAPTGLLGTFMLAMRQSDVNKKLVNKGIYVQYKAGARGQPGVYSIVTKAGTTEVPDTAKEIGNYRLQKFMNGKAFDREMKAVIAQHFEGAMKRKVIKAIRKNTGNKMCILFCNRQDNDKLSRSEKFNARKEKYYNMMAKATADVVLNSSARTQLLIYCLLQDCSKDALKKRAREIGTEEARLLANDSRELEEMSRDGAELRNQTRKVAISKLFIRRVLTKMLGETAAKTVVNSGSKALGPLGLVLLVIAMGAAQHDLSDILYDFSGDHKFQFMWDEAKKPMAAGAHNIVTTGADEMFGAGHGRQDYDLAALAAFDDRLNGIEKSEAYPYMFGSLTTAKTVQTGVAKCEGYPASPELDHSSGDANIFCTNNRFGTEPPVMRNLALMRKLYPLPTKIMETWMQIQYWTGGTVASFLQEYIVDNVIDFITKIVFDNPVMDGIGGVIGTGVKWLIEHEPIKGLVDDLKTVIEEAMGDLLQFFLPLPARDQQELRGPKLATWSMLGADWTNQRYAAGMKNEDGSVNGLAAPEMNRDAANTLYSQIEAEEREDLKYASVNNRYFSLTNPKSLLAQFILMGPAASATSPQGFATMASNPFSSMLTSAANIMTQRVHAAPQIRHVGATGTVFYAYPQNSELYTSEPLENLDGDECNEIIQKGVEETDELDRIGDPILKYTKEAQQCLLDMNVVDVGTLESKKGEGDI